MIDDGFIKIFRKFVSWEWYDDSKTMHLFLHCLLKANYRDKKWHGVLIKRGSFITSLRKLSVETGISIQSIRTSLKRLEQTEEVTQQSTQGCTHLTVTNYESYQRKPNEANTEINTQLTHDQHSANTVPTHDQHLLKNDKNDKNKKEKYIKEKSEMTAGLMDLKTALFNRYKNITPDMSGFRGAMLQVLDQGISIDAINEVCAFLGKREKWEYIPGFGTPSQFLQKFTNLQEAMDRTEEKLSAEDKLWLELEGKQ